MDAKQVLVIQTAFIGDALLTIPLLRRVKEITGEAKLTFLCRKGLGDFFLKLGLVDSVIEYDKTNTADWDRVQAEVLKNSYDLVISPHQSYRSETLVKKVKAKTKIGYSKWWNFIIFNKRVQRPMQFPEVMRLMALLAPIDDETKKLIGEYKKSKALDNSDEQGTVNFTHAEKIPDLFSMQIKGLKLEHEQNSVDKIIRENRLQTYRLVLMAPGSVWNTKKWTAEGFASLAQKLEESGYQVAVIGSDSEKADCEAVCAQHRNIINLCGKTNLVESLVLMEKSALLVSNDSGAAHLAAVVGLKTVSIFGPTVLKLGYRPWNNLTIVNQIPLNCRPCGKHGGEKCPINTHDCMKKVDSTNVLVNAEKLLKRL